MKVAIKRIYEPSAPEDGTRILVDRLWPRGVAKSEAHIDLWLKEVAPSTELREWFGHDPAKWKEFQTRYKEELRANPALQTLRDACQKSHVTLLYGAKDEVHNHALVLQAALSS